MLNRLGVKHTTDLCRFDFYHLLREKKRIRKEMHKIIYDYQIFSWQRYGGISRYIYELAHHLDKQADMSVNILAGAYVNEYLKKSKPGLVWGFPVPYLPRRKYHQLLGFFNYKISETLLNSKKPDIIHETYYSNKRLITKDAKVVLTVHDMTHERLNQFFNHRDIFQFKDKTSLIKKGAIQRADRIICISEHTKKDLIEIFDIEESKISVIYHGYSSGRNLILDGEKKSLKPYIFYVGERGGYKNFTRILKAYVSSDELRKNFQIICFGGGTFSAQEREIMEQLGIKEGEVVQISGDDISLANYYHNAAIFVYPSLYEGFGFPLLEAMAVQCPVVCSNTSSLPEVAGEAAEFFNPYEPESIANAMENVLFSTQKRETLILEGTKRVKQFSWESCAEQTKELYLSLV